MDTAKEVRMSRKRYSPEKIIGMLREAEVALAQGMTVNQIKYIVSELYERIKFEWEPRDKSMQVPMKSGSWR